MAVKTKISRIILPKENPFLFHDCLYPVRSVYNKSYRIISACITPLISPFVNNLLQNHDLQHCIAQIVLIVKEAQLPYKYSNLGLKSLNQKYFEICPNYQIENMDASVKKKDKHSCKQKKSNLLGFY